MDIGIVQSLTVCIWSLYAYGDLGHQIPICKYLHMGIPVDPHKWGLIAKKLHMGIPICIWCLLAYGDLHVRPCVHFKFQWSAAHSKREAALSQSSYLPST